MAVPKSLGACADTALLPLYTDHPHAPLAVPLLTNRMHAYLVPFLQVEYITRIIQRHMATVGGL